MQGNSTVTFNGTAATPTSWSATGIVVPVPAGATTGNVVVTVGGLASNGARFTVQLPDLIVTGIGWAPPNPVAGSVVTFSGTVTNQGTVATPAGVCVTLAFWVDNSNMMYGTLGSNCFQSLAAGASASITATSATWTATAGTHTILAMVDDANRIQESNKNNNTLTQTMTVGLAYAISGTITSSSAGLPGVTVTLSGGQGATSTTGSSGAYSFTVNAGGSYTVTPSMTGYTFSPPSVSVPNIAANQTANFAASAPYTIIGQVTEAGAGVAGATVSLSGSATGSTVTNSSGNYSLSAAAGGSYVATPSMTNFTFTPASASYANLSANQVANFAGNQFPWAVSVSPANGSASRQTFTFTWRDPDGVADFDWTMIAIESPLSAAQTGCVILYQPSYQLQYIQLGDNNTATPNWIQATPGSGSPLTTSLGMCTLYPATSLSSQK
jgi:hypothetical protein